MSLKWTDYLEAVKKVRSRNDGTVQGRTFQMQTSHNENIYPSFCNSQNNYYHNYQIQ